MRLTDRATPGALTPKDCSLGPCPYRFPLAPTHPRTERGAVRGEPSNESACQAICDPSTQTPSARQAHPG